MGKADHESLGAYPLEHGNCRDYGHMWQQWRVVRGGVHHGAQRKSWFTRWLYCVRENGCSSGGSTTIIKQVLDAMGRVVTRSYSYADDYLLDGSNLTAGEVRQAVRVGRLEQQAALPQPEGDPR